MQKIRLNDLQSIDNAEKTISAIASGMQTICDAQSWPETLLLKHAHDQSILTLDDHLADLSLNAQVLVQKDAQPDEMAKDKELLFKRWHIEKNPQSL